MHQSKVKNKRKLWGKRLAALGIAMTLFVTMFQAVPAFAAGNSGFSLGLAWTGTASADYVWDASSNETKTVRLQVSYNNKAPEKGYAPGELVITVPGIGNAVRSGTKAATDVAADKAGSPVKTKNWSYTYNSKNDTYTFTNNVAVSANTSFTGSFELLWTLNARDTIDGYRQGLQAALQTSDNIRVTSNSLTYAQTRTKDAFTINQLPKALYTAEGINGGLKVEDYYWVGFTVTGSRVTKALGIESSYYKVTVPNGAVVTHALNSKTQETLPVKKDGSTFLIEQNAGVNPYTYANGSEWTYIFVAYPKSQYNDDSQVQSGLELWGTYADHTTAEKLTDVGSNLRMGDYQFNKHPGNLYTLTARAMGTRVQYTFHGNDRNTPENLECYNDGFLNATDLISGKRSGEFRLGSSLYTASADNFYSMEFGNDFFDVQLNSGNYRQLGNGEYEYTSVEIPSVNRFRNDNNVPVQSGAYGLDIYAKTLADPNHEVLVTSTAIKDVSQSVTLPAGTYSVRMKLNALKENVNFENWQTFVSPISVKTKFHVQDDAGLPFADRIKTDNGLLNNSFWYKIYDKDGKWVNNDYTEADYENSTNLDVAKRDMDTYGVYMQRVKDALHIHEIVSLYYNHTQLADPVRSAYGFDVQGTMRTYFKYADDAQLGKFSMSTVLPDGLRLPYSQVDAVDFLSAASFSGLGLTSAELGSHVAVTIDTNYQGSGRVYLRLDFDLTSLQIEDPGSVTASFPLFVSNEDFSRVGSNYQLQSATVIDDTAYISRAQYNGAADDGAYDKNALLWNDINRNGNSTESLSYSNTNLTIQAAAEIHVEAAKSVATEYTNGQYFSGSGKEIPKVGFDGAYSYKLKLSTAQNNEAANIVFIDHLETGLNAAWKGAFQNVDLSFAKSMGFNPTVYYSLSETQPDSLADPGWTTQLPANPALVRTIAVDMGTKQLPTSSFVYVLVQMTAPATDAALFTKVTENDYDVAFTSIDTTTGVRTETNLPSNLCQVSLTYPLGRVMLTKTDNTGVLLPGVTFDLLDNTMNVVKAGLITDSAGNIRVDDLTYGTYYFRETKTPPGYILDQTPIKVVVDSRSVQVNAVNQRKPGQVSLTKRNSENLQLYVEGAQFSLYRANGTLVQAGLTTDRQGTLNAAMYPILGNLEWGSYYFQETKAPNGYLLDETPIPFKLDAASAEAGVTALSIVNHQDGGANLQFTKYEILEDGTTQTTTPVSNAVYELFFISSSGDKSLGTYITDEHGEIYISGLIYGNYYLIEKSAPQGYYLNTDKVPFTVDAAHIGANAQTAVSYNVRQYGNINLYKIGDNKEEIKDAVFGLYDANTNALIRQGTTTAEGVIDFKNIPWGNYYLKEISAPGGYELNPKQYPVTIDRTNAGTVVPITAENAQVKGSVRLTKMDQTNPDIKLAGAEFDLYKTDGTRIGSYTTDANGQIYVENLRWGAYYFQETKAPAGYALSSDLLRFSVNAVNSAVTQELEAYNTMGAGGSLTITKKIRFADINLSHGDPVFTFHVEGTDLNSTPHAFSQTAVFSAEALAGMTPDSGGFVSLQVTFAGIPAGTYTVTEAKVIRYSQTGIEDVSANGIVNPDGTVRFDMTAAASGEATFVNGKQVQSGTSHTAALKNVIRASKMLTGLTASYRGGTITDKLNRSLLDVYAQYDDGTQKKLGNADYALDTESFEGLTPGVFTVTASYTEGGATRKATFNVNIDPAMPFTWTYANDPDDGVQKAKITGYTGSSSIVRFPSQVKDKTTGVVYPVMSIGSGSSISGMSAASGILIPEGIKKIETNAFYYASNLTGNLKLPSTLKKIDNNAFMKTNFKGDLVIPASVQTIASNAFNASGFDGTLTLPNGLTSIGGNAFSYMASIKGDIVIPGSVATIDSYAFQNSAFDGTLTLQPGISSIGNSAFSNLKKIKGDIIIPDSVVTMDNKTFYFSTFDGAVKLPENGTFTRIPTEAFRQTNITGIAKIPNNITTIGNSAFYQAKTLEGIDFPANLTAIENSAFSQCDGLQSIFINGAAQNGLAFPATTKIIGDSAFQVNSSVISKLQGPLTLPAGLETIGGSAFSWQRFLTDFELPSSVTSIGTYAFNGCESLKVTSGNLVLPQNMTEVPDRIFGECKSLNATLTLPPNATRIGTYAFNNCATLTGQLNLPAALSTIDSYAFQYCTGFTGQINLPANLTTIKDDAFQGCTGFTGQLIIPEKVTTLGGSAFYRCRGLEGEVVLPDSLTEIGTYAFNECIKITGVKLPAQLKKIGTRAFQNCYALAGALNLPDTVESVGDGAFFNCSKITSLKLPVNDEFTVIDRQSFYSCGIVEIIIPDNVTTIKDEAFRSGSATTTLVLSKNLTSIGAGAFNGRSSVTGTIRVPATITDPAAIGKDAFNTFGRVGFCTVELPRICEGYQANYATKWNAAVTFYD